MKKTVPDASALKKCTSDEQRTIRLRLLCAPRKLVSITKPTAQVENASTNQAKTFLPPKNSEILRLLTLDDVHKFVLSVRGFSVAPDTGYKQKLINHVRLSVNRDKSESYSMRAGSMVSICFNYSSFLRLVLSVDRRALQLSRRSTSKKKKQSFYFHACDKKLIDKR